MFIKGVNLGNWLVLEKWMAPALFEGTDAEDEYYLPRRLAPEVYEARIKLHRSEFISERDFAAIKRMGMNAVRIPVPYFIFGGRPPFIGCVDELDKAFNWAEKYGIQILIDLHTAPLSQNGFDNGGICGVCKWADEPEEVEFVLTVLERLAKRYGHRPGLLGITPINEPITADMWDTFRVQERYIPVDVELAKGSAPNTLEFLQEFYTNAYSRIHPQLAAGKQVVFHDAFLLDAWKQFLLVSNFQDVMLDTHQYLMMAELEGCEQTLDGYLRHIQEHYARPIAEVQAYVPVVCGEWSLFNSAAVGADTRGGQSVLNGVRNAGSRLPWDGPDLQALYLKIAKAQLAAWEQGSGFFYWTWKMLLDPANDPAWHGWDCWDLAKSIDLGWFPAPL